MGEGRQDPWDSEDGGGGTGPPGVMLGEGRQDPWDSDDGGGGTGPPGQ